MLFYTPETGFRKYHLQDHVSNLHNTWFKRCYDPLRAFKKTPWTLQHGVKPLTLESYDPQRLWYTCWFYWACWPLFIDKLDLVYGWSWKHLIRGCWSKSKSSDTINFYKRSNRLGKKLQRWWEIWGDGGRRKRPLKHISKKDSRQPRPFWTPERNEAVTWCISKYGSI